LADAQQPDPLVNDPTTEESSELAASEFRAADHVGAIDPHSAQPVRGLVQRENNDDNQEGCNPARAEGKEQPRCDVEN